MKTKSLLTISTFALSSLCYAGPLDWLIPSKPVKAEINVQTDLPAATKNLKEAADALDVMGYKGLLERIEKKDANIQELQAQVGRLVKALTPTDARLNPQWKRPLAPTGRWRKVGFTVSQLKQLEAALNVAHVAPDGVKFAWGINDTGNHEASISAWIREGDDLPIKYVVTEIVNPGVAGAMANFVEENLKTREIIPIGYTWGSRTFVYASAEMMTAADSIKSP